MAAVAELATSRLVMPARFGSVGIDVELYFRALLEPIVLYDLHAAERPQNILHLSGEAAEIFVVGGFLLRIDVGRAGDADLDGKFDGIGLQLVNGDVGAGRFRRRARIADCADYAGRDFFSLSWISTWA